MPETLSPRNDVVSTAPAVLPRQRLGSWFSVDSWSKLPRPFRLELPTRTSGTGTALRQAREEGLEKGREAGREEGVRTAIEALCGSLAIELTPSRRSVLEGMSTSELTALLEGILQQRRWPEH